MSRILYKYINIEGARWMLGMEKGRRYPNLQFTNPSKQNDPFDCDKNLLDYSDIPDAMTQGWIPKEWLREKEINDAHNKRYFAWICSLSKVNDELLMWAHYCNNHSGICVGLNVDSIVKNVHPFFDSIYCEPLVEEVQYRDITQRPDFKTVPWNYQLVTKDNKWEYEQEVRLIFPHATHFNAAFSETAKSNDATELCDYLPLKGECFESIYFGVNIDPKEKEKIIKFVRKKLNPDTKLYQMQVDENAFRLKAEPIIEK